MECSIKQVMSHGLPTTSTLLDWSNTTSLLCGPNCDEPSFGHHARLSVFLEVSKIHRTNGHRSSLASLTQTSFDRYISLTGWVMLIHFEISRKWMSNVHWRGMIIGDVWVGCRDWCVEYVAIHVNWGLIYFLIAFQSDIYPEMTKLAIHQQSVAWFACAACWFRVEIQEVKTCNLQMDQFWSSVLTRDTVNFELFHKDVVFLTFFVKHPF